LLHGGERTGTRRIILPRRLEMAPSVDRKGASAKEETMKIVMAIIKPFKLDEVRGVRRDTPRSIAAPNMP
jgi:hypothetical protein